MRGVFRCRRPERHDSVVAGTLTFRAEATLGDPDQRMKPVESARESSNELTERVSTRDVRQLVTQDNAAMGFRPVQSVLRQENHGSARSPGERSADNRVGEKTYLLVDIGFLALLVQDPAPVGVVERPRRPADPVKSNTADGEPGENSNYSQRPQNRQHGGDAFDISSRCTVRSVDDRRGEG